MDKKKQSVYRIGKKKANKRKLSRMFFFFNSLQKIYRGFHAFFGGDVESRNFDLRVTESHPSLDFPPFLLWVVFDVCHVQKESSAEMHAPVSHELRVVFLGTVNVDDAVRLTGLRWRVSPENGISESDGFICTDKFVKNVRTPFLIVADNKLFPRMISIPKSVKHADAVVSLDRLTVTTVGSRPNTTAPL